MAEGKRGTGQALVFNQKLNGRVYEVRVAPAIADNLDRLRTTATHDTAITRAVHEQQQLANRYSVTAFSLLGPAVSEHLKRAKLLARAKELVEDSSRQEAAIITLVEDAAMQDWRLLSTEPVKPLYEMACHFALALPVDKAQAFYNIMSDRAGKVLRPGQQPERWHRLVQKHWVTMESDNDKPKEDAIQLFTFTKKAVSELIAQVEGLSENVAASRYEMLRKKAYFPLTTMKTAIVKKVKLKECKKRILMLS